MKLQLPAFIYPRGPIDPLRPEAPLYPQKPHPHESSDAVGPGLDYLTQPKSFTACKNPRPICVLEHCLG